MNNRIFGGRDEDTSTLRQLGGAAENGAEMLQRARLALDRDLRNQMLKWEWLPTNSDNRLKFQNAGEAFSKTAAETITLLGLASWPLMILAGLLFVTAVFVIVVL